MDKTEVIIIGASASGLFCAIEAGKRRRHVVVLDHANKPGKKILVSGGGRCNFTNINTHPDHFISHNPHFCKSALSRYTAWDFIELVKKHRIAYHEKTLGQLFCDHKSKDILEMLLSECESVNVDIRLNASIEQIEKINDHHYKIKSTRGDFHCESLVIATGGLSMPTMGASPFGYKVAQQFDIPVFPTRAGLVPLTLHPEDKARFAELSGIAVASRVSNDRKQFDENILFTHRGMSGPAILQISSYWNPGEAIDINLLPHLSFFDYLKSAQIEQAPKQLNTILSELLPNRVVDLFLDDQFADKKIASIAHQDLKNIARQFSAWELRPNGTEGYRTAEVTIGGVDCNALSSKTMGVNHVPGLFFIGEVVDVTGWLGGYNFQWAWSSGWAAGQYV